MTCMTPDLRLGVELSLAATAYDIEGLRLVIREAVEAGFHAELAETLIDRLAQRIEIVRQSLGPASEARVACTAPIEVC
jgi:hypothetical protein